MTEVDRALPAPGRGAVPAPRRRAGPDGRRPHGTTTETKEQHHDHDDQPEATIEADPDLPVITITREFDAPPERVFRACDRPRAGRQWIGPRSVDMDIDDVGLPHRRQLPLRRRPRRRGDRPLLRLVPRGPAGRAARPDVHLRGLPGRRVPGDHDVRGRSSGGRTPDRHASPSSTRSRRSDGMLASGMEVGINEGYEKLDELLAAGRAERMTPPRSTAGSRPASPSGSGRRRLGRPRTGRGVGRA